MAGGRAWPEPEKYQTPKQYWAWEGHKAAPHYWYDADQIPTDGLTRIGRRNAGQAYCYVYGDVWYHYKCEHA